MDLPKWISLLSEAFSPGRIKQNADLSAYTTMHFQVTADMLFEARTRDEFVKIVQFSITHSIPFLIIGGGSNIAFIRNHVFGLVIRNMYQELSIGLENSSGIEITVSSGYPMARLVAETVQKGFSGFEYHLGLPGTVGGAIYMNSKWTKPLTYVGDRLVYAWIIDAQAQEKKVDHDYFQFAYDFSILQRTKEIVIDVQFRVHKEDPAILKKRAAEALAYRKSTQPMGIATCGCFFQNISTEDAHKAQVPTTSAGYLIDHAGLKGYHVGGFKVSDKHANFIVNTGSGNPDDLVRLLADIQKSVYDKYGIVLKEEVVRY